MTGNPLGEKVPAPSKYDPGILYPIPRWPARSLLDIDKKMPLHGIDHWHAYEISWLNQKGRPEVAIGQFYFDADSENIVESKSLKLYLNGFNQERLDSREALAELIGNDLSALSRSSVTVRLEPPGSPPPLVDTPRSSSLDGYDIAVEQFQPAPELLRRGEGAVFDECLHSHLFRSQCPVTGQPDWASVSLQYTGQQIDEQSLLAYLCSYREHQGYHEECAERIYRDLMVHCEPAELHLAMNFLRRGGLDINVYRSSVPVSSDIIRPRHRRQ